MNSEAYICAVEAAVLHRRGKIILEEKRSLNPFAKKDGGGKFRLESD